MRGDSPNGAYRSSSPGASLRSVKPRHRRAFWITLLIVYALFAISAAHSRRAVDDCVAGGHAASWCEGRQYDVSSHPLDYAIVAALVVVTLYGIGAFAWRRLRSRTPQPA